MQRALFPPVVGHDDQHPSQDTDADHDDITAVEAGAHVASRVRHEDQMANGIGVESSGQNGLGQAVRMRSMSVFGCEWAAHHRKSAGI